MHETQKLNEIIILIEFDCDEFKADIERRIVRCETGSISHTRQNIFEKS